MSLNQKYTWHDFLKQHPEHAEKDTKRTSPEGKKAFEQAYKTFVKDYLASRSEKAQKIIDRVKEKRNALQSKAKEIRKAGKIIKVKLVDKKISKADAAIGRISKMAEKTKSLQKSFK
jgi:hypothetical protein